MPIKRLLCPARVRRIPPQFSWVDQRLVRDEIIGLCGADALALYLFLVTVADERGLSYYSDHAIVRRLALDASRLCHARGALLQVDLIAFEKPLYQVLALDGWKTPAAVPANPPIARRTGRPVAVQQERVQVLQCNMPRDNVMRSFVFRCFDRMACRRIMNAEHLGDLFHRAVAGAIGFGHAFL